MGELNTNSSWKKLQTKKALSCSEQLGAALTEMVFCLFPVHNNYWDQMRKKKCPTFHCCYNKRKIPWSSHIFKIFISKNWTVIPKMSAGRTGYWFHIKIHFDVFATWWLKKKSFSSFVHLFFFCGSYCVPCTTFTAKERSLAQSQAFLEHTVLFASALRSAAEKEILLESTLIYLLFTLICINSDLTICLEADTCEWLSVSVHGN